MTCSTGTYQAQEYGIADEGFRRLDQQVQADAEGQQCGKHDGAHDEMSHIFAKDAELSFHVATSSRWPS